MKDKIRNGIYGYLIGDAVGVPYEGNTSEKLHRLEFIDMIPPKKFNRSHKEVKPGTWSDDGAQMLCMLSSVIECRNFNINNLAKKLLTWFEKGYMAVNQKVYGVTDQTSRALREYSKTKNPLTSGKYGKDNGSLSRVFPLAFASYTDEKLVEYAHTQSLITHVDIIPQICCAFYVLWVREVARGMNLKDAYTSALMLLKKIYEGNNEYLNVLNKTLCLEDETIKGRGTTNVLDTIRGVRDILFETTDYKSVIINSILLGHDTDTTAAIAGALAGVYYGNSSIPEEWLRLLKGKNIVEKLLSNYTQ